MTELSALEFLNIIQPNHGRISCKDNDETPLNGFGTAGGGSWHGRCKRCMYLELISGVEVPVDFEPMG